MAASALDREQIFWAYDRHCEGYTFQEVADALYVCVDTIRDEFKRWELKRNLPPLTYSPEEQVREVVKFTPSSRRILNAHQINWAYHYHWKYYSLQELSSFLGVNHETLVLAFRRNHLKIRYRKINRKPLVYRGYEKEENHDH